MGRRDDTDTETGTDDLDDLLLRRRARQRADAHRFRVYAGIGAGVGLLVLVLAGVGAGPDRAADAGGGGALPGPGAVAAGGSKQRDAARAMIAEICDVEKFHEVDGPEYADVASPPQSFAGWADDVAAQHRGEKRPARPAKSAVRVRFTERNFRDRRESQDWIVWFDASGEIIDYSENLGGGDWRGYVRRLADEK